MVSVTPDGLWMLSDRIVKSRFFVKFHRSRPAIFSFWTIMEHVSNPSKKLAKDMLWNYGWFLNCKFSIFLPGPDLQKCFSYWTIMEHISYSSKKLLIKKRPNKHDECYCKRWWVLILKDYGWFLIELSRIMDGSYRIIDFSSNFTCPDLQWFSAFELSWSMVVIHQISS